MEAFTMSLARLTELVPPPAHPTEVGTREEWEQKERELGTKLPEDYRQFVFTYGTGLFGNLYVVLNPFAASEHIALVPRSRAICEIYREIKEREGAEAVPYPIFPERGGLLPCAVDQNGNFYFWLTKGRPGAWRVVQDKSRGVGMTAHDCSLTGFLVGVLDGKIKALASGYPNQRSFRFVSHKEKG
jgi:hypothetical protein